MSENKNKEEIIAQILENNEYPPSNQEQRQEEITRK
jgi:hypothetical protein